MIKWVFKFWICKLDFYILLCIEIVVVKNDRMGGSIKYIGFFCLRYYLMGKGFLGWFEYV